MVERYDRKKDAEKGVKNGWNKTKSEKMNKSSEKIEKKIQREKCPLGTNDDRSNNEF